MLYKKKLPDFENRVVINCGGTRHETLKVREKTLCTQFMFHVSDNLEEDSSNKTFKID